MLASTPYAPPYENQGFRKETFFAPPKGKKSRIYKGFWHFLLFQNPKNEIKLNS